MNKKKALFVHGGPGLNANPEENLLKKKLEDNGLDVFFWNEPSNLRPEGFKFESKNAYSNWQTSLISKIEEIDGKMILIGSSFGALGILDLLKKIENKLEKLVFISPTFYLDDVFKKMMEFSIVDFKSLNDTSKFEELKKLYDSTNDFFDSPMQRGLELVYQNPHLFPHYWVSEAKMVSWAGFLADEKFQIDPISQNAVLMELKEVYGKPNNLKCNLKLDVIFGAQDPVYFEQKNKKLLSEIFNDIQYHKFEKSSHFPHIEEEDNFIKILK